MSEGQVAEHHVERADIAPARPQRLETAPAEASQAHLIGGLQSQIGNQAVVAALTKPYEVVETIKGWFTGAKRKEDMTPGRKDTLARMALSLTPAVTNLVKDFKQSALDRILQAIDSYAVGSEPLLSGAATQRKLAKAKKELKAASDDPFPEHEGVTVHRILSYFSGEVPIHAAAMHMDPDSKIELYYDAQYYLIQYARSASLEGLATPQAYHTEVLGRDSDKSDDAILDGMLKQGLVSVGRMKDELISLGVLDKRIRLVYVDNIDTAPIKRSVSDTHALVARRFQAGEETERGTLPERIFARIDGSRKAEIAKIPEQLGLGKDKPAALLWQRYSGLAPGGAYPELDTNLRVLDQIIAMIRQKFPDYKIILVGDEPPDSKYEEQFGKGLVRFWASYTLNRGEQVYLLDLLRKDHKAVAIGMESGAIELPALLGMKTIYMERTYMRTGKAERWTYVSGASTQDLPGGAAQKVSGAVSTWRRQQFEAPTEWLFPFERLKRLRTRVEPSDATQEQCRAALEAIKAVLGSWHHDVQELSHEVTATQHADVDWIDLNQKLAGLLLDLLERAYDLSDIDEDGIVSATKSYVNSALGPFLDAFQVLIDNRAFEGPDNLLQLSKGELRHLALTIDAMLGATEIPKEEEKRTYRKVSKENRELGKEPYHYGPQWIKLWVVSQPAVDDVAAEVRKIQLNLQDCAQQLEVSKDEGRTQQVPDKVLKILNGKLQGLSNEAERATKQLEEARENQPIGLHPERVWVASIQQRDARIKQLDDELTKIKGGIEALKAHLRFTR